MVIFSRMKSGYVKLWWSLSSIHPLHRRSEGQDSKSFFVIMARQLATRLSCILMALCLSQATWARGVGGSGGFVQLSLETGTHQVLDQSKKIPAWGLDGRLGSYSKAWRDFYRYVGVGGSLYQLDASNDGSVDTSEFNGTESNSYATVFVFGGIALNAPVSPFIEVGLNGAEWINGHYVDESTFMQNGFVKGGLDLKSRNGTWLQIFYKLNTTQDVAMLEKIVTTGVTAGMAF